MSRPLRIEYPGGVYHVTPKRNERGETFCIPLMLRKVGIRMEDRKMISKSKLRSFIFILLSGAVLLLPFVVYAQAPIDFGQTLSGMISTAGQRNSYTFSVSANDGITIRARKTSGSMTPYIELYSPGGTLITGAASQKK